MSDVVLRHCERLCKNYLGTKLGDYGATGDVKCKLSKEPIKVKGLTITSNGNAIVDCPGEIQRKAEVQEIPEPQEEKCGLCNAFVETKFGGRCCAAPQEVVKLSKEWCRKWEPK